MSKWDGKTFPWTGDMPDEQYFALDSVDGEHVWDQTQLKNWMTGPIEWAQSFQNEPTPAMRFGTAAHALVLGSGAPVKAAEHTLRSKVGREEAEEAKKQGITLLPPADFEAVTRMAEVTNPVFKEIGGRPEVTMLARLKTKSGDQFLAKGKADWLPSKPDSEGIYRIWDYKTTSAPLDDFPRTAVNSGYDIQAAYYLALAAACDLIPEGAPEGFAWLVQEKTPPYAYRIFDLDTGDVLLTAADLIASTIKDVKAFEASGGTLDGLREEIADPARRAETVRKFTGEPIDLVWPDWGYQVRDKQIEALQYE